MARSFLVPINLNSLELQNFIVHNLENNPTNVNGRLYYNSTDHTLKFYKGGSTGSGWQTLATGGSSITFGGTVVNIGGTTNSLAGIDGSTLTIGSSNNAFTIWDGATIAVNRGGTGSTTGSITGSGALTFQAGAGNHNINLRPTGTGSVDLNSTNGTDGFKLTGLKNPTNDFDAANKKYVDDVASGLNAHAAVNYATTGALGTPGNLVGGTITTTYNNGTLNDGVGATLTIATSSNWTDILLDGQNVVVGHRILIKNQGGTTSNLQNGIYTVTSVGTVGTSTSFVFTRAVDYNTLGEVAPGDTTYVLAGGANGGNGFVQTATIVALGTTPIAWSQFSGSSVAKAGAGLVANSTNPNLLDVNAAGGLSINVSDQLIITDIAGLTTGTNFGTSTAVPAIQVNAKGQVTSLGSTNIGGLNANVISTGTLVVANGGTGASTLTGYVKGNGTTALTAATTIPGADISGAVASATSATDATNSTNVNVTDTTSSSGAWYPVFSPTGTNGQKALVMNSAGVNSISFDNSTGVFFSSNGFTTGSTGIVTAPTFRAAPVTSGAGIAASLNAGDNSVAGGTAGALTVRGGDSSGSTGSTVGGAVAIRGGAASAATAGVGGAITINGGQGGATGGSITINGGQGGTTRGSILIGTNTDNTSAITIGATTATTTGVSQTITIGSTSNWSGGSPSDTTVRGTDNSNTNGTRGGHLVLMGGSATGGGAGAARGGDVLITAGNFNTGGRVGDIFIGASTTRNIEIATGLSTAGTLTVGTTNGTGKITIGQSTAAQTVDIATGANSSSAKTLNLGTGGTGSTTAVNISTATGGTTTINGTAVHSGGKTTFAAATTGYGSVNIADGTTPTSGLATGDLWAASGNLLYRSSVGPATKTIAFTDSQINGTTIPSNSTLLTSTTGVVSVNGTSGTITNIAVINAGQTFTGAQTVIAASTQDAVRLQGRAGGTTNLVATLTPGTLTHNQTLTLPNANGAQTFTVARRLTNTITLIANTNATITHNMDNRFVLVQMFDNSAGALVEMDVTLTDANTVTVQSAVPGTYRWVIIG